AVWTPLPVSGPTCAGCWRTHRWLCGRATHACPIGSACLFSAALLDLRSSAGSEGLEARGTLTEGSLLWIDTVPTEIPRSVK
ncbi:hypothetical protein ANANG_G00274160, partial [Anguilla anguilla]